MGILAWLTVISVAPSYHPLKGSSRRRIALDQCAGRARVQFGAMVWNRKQAMARRFPAKESHEVLLSPAEKASRRTVAAAWPSGPMAAWLGSVPEAIMLPGKRRRKAARPCS
jgi:hypothetical protein